MGKWRHRQRLQGLPAGTGRVGPGATQLGLPSADPMTHTVSSHRSMWTRRRWPQGGRHVPARSLHTPIRAFAWVFLSPVMRVDTRVVIARAGVGDWGGPAGPEPAPLHLPHWGLTCVHAGIRDSQILQWNPESGSHPSRSRGTGLGLDEVAGLEHRPSPSGPGLPPTLPRVSPCTHFSPRVPCCSPHLACPAPPGPPAWDPPAEL